MRDLIIGSRKFTAADAYRAFYKVKQVQHLAGAFWRDHDVLVVPTVGTVLTIADVERDPLTSNFNNGYYTNFANPLGLAAIAAPWAVTKAGVPYGVTFLAPAGRERWLADLAEKFVGMAPLSA